MPSGNARKRKGQKKAAANKTPQTQPPQESKPVDQLFPGAANNTEVNGTETEIVEQKIESLELIDTTSEANGNHVDKFKDYLGNWNVNSISRL